MKKIIENLKWLFFCLSGRRYHYCLMPDKEPPEGTIVLVHGVLYRSLIMKYALGNYLAKNGYRVYVYDYRSTRFHIREHGKMFRRFLESIPEPFFIVTHSMGGLLTRVALEKPLATVEGVLMLAPPNQGSHAASFWYAEVPGAGVIAKSLPDMRYRYDGVTMSLPMPSGEMPIRIIGAKYDIQVAPKLLSLPQPVPLAMVDAGHCGMLWDAACRTRIMDFLHGIPWCD